MITDLSFDTVVLRVKYDVTVLIDDNVLVIVDEIVSEPVIDLKPVRILDETVFIENDCVIVEKSDLILDTDMLTMK